MKKALLILLGLTFLSNASVYVCKINDKNIIISTVDKKIFMDEGYGKRIGYLQGQEYVFGRGTGSIIIIRNNHGEIVKIIRDNNIETHISTSCYNFNNGKH